MKKIIVAFMLLAFSTTVVAKAHSPQIEHVQKFEFKKQDLQSFEIATLHLDAIVTAEIVVTEPTYIFNKVIHYFEVAKVNVFLDPFYRCNGPPAGINT